MTDVAQDVRYRRTFGTSRPCVARLSAIWGVTVYFVVRFSEGATEESKVVARQLGSWLSINAESRRWEVEIHQS